MKLIKKPIGFEFTDRRSTMAKSGELWRPTDAMYDANEEIAKQDCQALLVCWSEKLPNGDTQTHYRFSGEAGQAPALIMRTLGRIMNWS